MTASAAPHMFVAGDWRQAASGETYNTTSPATGERDRRDPPGRPLRRAGGDRRGGRGRRSLGARTAFERAAKMHAVGDVIESRRDELARTLTLDQGKPLKTEAYDEVDELVEYWRAAAEDGKRLGGELPNSFSPGKKVLLQRRPRGVVGVISPWNWPYTMPAELVAPALASGNAVVWTPAPTTALSAFALAQCIAEADLPPGVFNMVTGPGAVVGNEIAAQSGRRRHRFHRLDPDRPARRPGRGRQGAVLEMGGNGPVVLLDDGDVDAAVQATVTACFLCAGQSCTAGERILVHRAVYDEYVRSWRRW